MSLKNIGEMIDPRKNQQNIANPTHSEAHVIFNLPNDAAPHSELIHYC